MWHILKERKRLIPGFNRHYESKLENHVITYTRFSSFAPSQFWEGVFYFSRASTWNLNQQAFTLHYLELI